MMERRRARAPRSKPTSTGCSARSSIPAELVRWWGAMNVRTSLQEGSMAEGFVFDGAVMHIEGREQFPMAG